jgi:hypothetical protein
MAPQDGFEPPAFEVEARRSVLAELLGRGTPGRTRTSGLALRRRPLSPLSYESMVPAAGLEPASFRLKGVALPVELHRDGPLAWPRTTISLLKRQDSSQLSYERMGLGCQPSRGESGPPLSWLLVSTLGAYANPSTRPRGAASANRTPLAGVQARCQATRRMQHGAETGNRTRVYCLRNSRSPTELSRRAGPGRSARSWFEHKIRKIAPGSTVPLRGIEPPLCLVRSQVPYPLGDRGKVRDRGLEPRAGGPKPPGLPLPQSRMVLRLGLEPRLNRSRAGRVTSYTT